MLWTHPTSTDARKAQLKGQLKFRLYEEGTVKIGVHRSWGRLTYPRAPIVMDGVRLSVTEVNH